MDSKKITDEVMKKYGFEAVILLGIVKDEGIIGAANGSFNPETTLQLTNAIQSVTKSLLAETIKGMFEKFEHISKSEKK